MTIDFRGRGAGQDFRRALDDLGSFCPDRRSSRGSSASALRKQRNRRIGAGLVAAASPSPRSSSWGRCSHRSAGERPPPRACRAVSILYGDWDASEQRADWYTVRTDGTGLRDLGLNATCAVWLPDGSRILATNDTAEGSGRRLRPAIDRSGWVEPSSARRDDEPRSEPGVRRRVARRDADRPRGVRSGRTSCVGRDLLCPGIGWRRARPASPRAGLPPRYSSDGTRLSFFDTREGVSPTGSGALFVVRADGSGSPSRHSVGLRVRRSRVVTRRNVDRVPEAVRTALSRAPRWVRAPPRPAQPRIGDRRAESVVVARWRVDRVQPPARRTRRALPGPPRRHRAAPGDPPLRELRPNIPIGEQLRPRVLRGEARTYRRTLPCPSGTGEDAPRGASGEARAKDADGLTSSVGIRGDRHCAGAELRRS